MHRSTMKIKASSIRDKILYHPHDKDMVETYLFRFDNPDYLLSICGNRVHKTQCFINTFFLALDGKMDKDHEVNGATEE